MEGKCVGMFRKHCPEMWHLTCAMQPEFHPQAPYGGRRKQTSKAVLCFYTHAHKISRVFFFLSRSGEMAQWVTHLLCKNKALNSNLRAGEVVHQFIKQQLLPGDWGTDIAEEKLTRQVAWPVRW